MGGTQVRGLILKINPRPHLPLMQGVCKSYWSGRIKVAMVISQQVFLNFGAFLFKLGLPVVPHKAVAEVSE